MGMEPARFFGPLAPRREHAEARVACLRATRTFESAATEVIAGGADTSWPGDVVTAARTAIGIDESIADHDLTSQAVHAPATTYDISPQTAGLYSSAPGHKRPLGTLGMRDAARLTKARHQFRVPLF